MKNTLYTFLFSLILGFTAQAQVLNVPTVEQEQDLWCWAGVSKSAMDYYGAVNEQCEIVEWVRQNYGGFGNDPCCENPSGPCNNTNDIGGEGSGGVQDILKHYLGYNSTLKSFSNTVEQDIVNAISNNRVVPCAWQYFPAGGHAVLIHGYENGYVYYMNPWFGEGKKITPYSSFASGNEGQAPHSWTFSVFIDDNTNGNSVTCDTPTNLSLEDVGSTYARAYWDETSNAEYYNIRLKAQGETIWFDAPSTSDSNSVLIKKLSPNTTYEVQVAGVCNQNSTSNYSSSQYITTLTASEDYCASESNGTFMSWIQNVKLGSIDHSYPRDYEYMDFTHISTSLTIGSSTPMELTYQEQDLYGQREYWAIYVDWNQDKDFDDADEIVYRPGSSAPKSLYLNLNVPAHALPGKTRMRITIGRNNPVSPCGTVSGGEVEDYTLNIIPDGPPICDAVSGLSASNTSHNSFTISWSASSNADSYNVDYREAGGSWNTVNTSTTSYDFSGLAAETSYEVKVETVCSFGNSEYSSSLSVTTNAAPTCDVVSDLSTSNISDQSFTVSWTGDVDANSYDIDYREAGGSWSTVNTSNTTYNLTGLTAETTYEVKVATICSFGNSAYSNTVSATTLAEPICDTPTSLILSNETTTSITASWNASINANSYTLQIRELGDTWNSVSTSNTSYDFTGLKPNTQYEVQITSVCSFGISASSAIVTTSTLDGPLVYCDANGNSVAGEWINAVAFGSINNTSNANGGYADFTAQSTSISAGTSTNITLTPGFASSWLFGTTTQPEFWSVWIDLNQDGDFTDANEQRFVSTTSSTSAVTATISIPSGTPAGTTRMRIAMKRSSAASSCESFANGEVEDYSVTIIEDLPPTCDVVTNLSISSITNNSFSATWNGDVDATSYNVDVRENGGAWTTISTTTASYNFTGLSAETNYEVKVSTVCSFGNSAESNIVSATTLSGPVEYCSASGNSTSEWIEAISLGNINNTSGADGGYADFTTQSASIEIGASASLTITPGFPYSWLFGYTTQAEFYSVWIDLNQDGDFDDANELQYVSPSSNSGYQAFSVSLSIPASAALGETRLRIAMKRGSAANSCEALANGEVEDYTVNIVSSFNGSARRTSFGKISELESSVYPNPAKQSTTLDLTIPANSGNASMRLMDLTGKSVVNGKWSSSEKEQHIQETIDVSSLPKGLYLMQVILENGASQNHKLVIE